MDPSSADPRRVALIGRAPERSWLNARVEEARAGTPHLALIVGEAGIGKSRLARDLISGIRDTRLVITRSRETPAGAFAPFRDSLFPALEPLAAAAGESSLRDDLRGVDAGDDLADHNHRFLSKVAALTIDLARQEFLTILVDDLHWADPLSLELVEFIAARATDGALGGPVPLFMACTARPPANDDLRARLERLEREPTASRLDLEGLGLFELTELARRHGHDDLRQRDVAALADATGGNPLFVEAILRTGSVPDRLRLPVHIRDAVAEPLADLVPADRELLEVASCLDDEFTTDLAAAVLGREPEDVRGDLHRLERAGLLDETSTGWEFAHPLYQRVVYEDIDPSAREAAHVRVAAQLEAAAAQESAEPVDARVLAHHLLEAPSLVDEDRLIPVVAQAGDLEFSSGNWTRAVTLYGIVRDRVHDGSIAGRRARAEMLHRLGRAMVFVGELDEGMKAFDESADLHLDNDDDEARLRVLVSRARAQVGSGVPGTPVDDAVLDRSLDTIETAAPHVAAIALAQLSQTRWMAGDLDAAVERADAALATASAGATQHESEAADARVMANLTKAMVGWTRFELDRSLEHLEAAADHSAAATDLGMQVGAGNRIPINLVWTGELHDATRRGLIALERGETVRYNVESGLPLTALGMADLLRGDPARAAERFERALRADQLTGYQWATIFALPSLSVAWDLLTRPDDAAAVLDQLDDRMGPNSSWTRAARILHSAERIRRVGADHRDAATPDGPILREGDAPSVGTAGVAAAAVELATATGEPALAVGAAPLLTVARERGLVYIGGAGILLGRALGRAMVLDGDVDAGIAELEAALQRASTDGAALELARTARDLATSLRERDGAADRDRAAHLSRRHHDLLESLGLVHLNPTSTTGDASREGTHTQIVVFADVSGSTRVTQEMGDVVYTTNLRGALSTIRDVVESCDGRVISHTGDGLLLTFDSATSAVDAALRSHEVLAPHPLDFHFGVHAGDVVEVDGNIFGATVNTAARLCDQAGAGETVVSELVRQLAAGASGLRFEDRGSPTLKGVVQPVRLFAVERES